MGRGVRDAHLEVLPGCFCPFMALVLAVCMLRFKIYSPGKIFARRTNMELPLYGNIKTRKCRSGVSPNYYILVLVCKNSCYWGGPPGGQGWSSCPMNRGWGTGMIHPGEEPTGGDEDGASLFTAAQQWLQHGRFRLDTEEKLFSYFPITNYLNMFPTSIAHPMLIFF